MPIGKKPSKKIQELVDKEYKRQLAVSSIDRIDITLNAIVKYLDEEYERKREE